MDLCVINDCLISGNTCFLNSVMQVLRYTPDFLNNLAWLNEDIIASEKIKKRNKSSSEVTRSSRLLPTF